MSIEITKGEKSMSCTINGLAILRNSKGLLAPSRTKNSPADTKPRFNAFLYLPREVGPDVSPDMKKFAEYGKKQLDEIEGVFKEIRKIYGKTKTSPWFSGVPFGKDSFLREDSEQYDVATLLGGGKWEYINVTGKNDTDIKRGFFPVHRIIKGPSGNSTTAMTREEQENTVKDGALIGYSLWLRFTELSCSAHFNGLTFRTHLVDLPSSSGGVKIENEVGLDEFGGDVDDWSSAE